MKVRKNNSSKENTRSSTAKTQTSTPRQTETPMDMRGKRLGDYILQEQTGEGGMGVVYKAFQVSLDRIVAVKILPISFLFRKGFKERFDLEAKAAANLQHPNIVTIYGYGEENGTYYFAMEFIEGDSLEYIIHKSHPIPILKAVNILMQILSALDYAHKQGVIHRDIKANNIMIDTNGRAIITDFGIAKSLHEARITISAAILGTPEYMSPEQATGQKVDKRSDLYSFGVLAYELLTCRVPFHGDSFLQTLELVKNQPAIPPHKLRKDIPASLSAVIIKCLEKDPAHRYQNAQDLHTTLIKFYQGQRITLLTSIKKRHIRKLILKLFVILTGLGLITYSMSLINDKGSWNETFKEIKSMIASSITTPSQSPTPLVIRPKLLNKDIVKVIEAEHWLRKSGERPVVKAPNASGNEAWCLGDKRLENSQGGSADGDFLAYSFDVSDNVRDADIEIRYSSSEGGNIVLIYFDDALVGQFTAEKTYEKNAVKADGSDGYTFFWSKPLNIGTISAGTHDLKLVVSASLFGINLDYYIIKGVYETPRKIQTQEPPEKNSYTVNISPAPDIPQHSDSTPPSDNDKTAPEKTEVRSDSADITRKNKKREDAVPYYNRGLLFYNLGNYKRAKEDFEKFLEIYPNHEKAEEVKDKLEAIDYFLIQPSKG